MSEAATTPRPRTAKPAVVGGASGAAPSKDPEADALIRIGKVTPAQLDRARRIASRMESERPIGEVLVELGMLTSESLERVTRYRQSRMSVAQLLREAGQLPDDKLKVYLAARKKTPPPSPRAILLDGGLVREEHYLRAVGAKLDIPYVEPQVGDIDRDVLGRLPFAYLTTNVVIPVKVEDDLLHVIVAEPEDEHLVGEIERSFGMRTKRFCATQTRIRETLRTLERLEGEGPSDSFSIQYRELDSSQENTDETGHEAVQLVDYLLTRAVQLQASDLHIEPTLNRIRVRVRIDGVLHELTDIPSDFGARLTARIKILARCDVTERRRHQDGKIHVRLEGSDIDIRVSTYVSTFGETIVMRLLDRDRGILPLADVGFQPRAFGTMTEVVLKASSGLVLMVGPTGSGKTTTLYSFIDHANDPTEKVITCEEPVEYVIDGIIQCSVNSKTGPTFEESLRAIVRQDPDTIVVGEIRDKITASLAIEAALTGHKVFSTFHTEEAVGAFVRLLEMGAEPFLVASTVSAVVAQRLVRRLCPECRRPAQPNAAQLRFIGMSRADIDGVDFYESNGCAACNHTGYRGRVAIHEVLVPNDPLREAVLDQAASAELRRLARDLPEYLTMQEDGVLKAISGVTSVSEIIENAPRDTSPRPLKQLSRIAQSARTR